MASNVIFTLHNNFWKLNYAGNIENTFIPNTLAGRQESGWWGAVWITMKWYPKSSLCVVSLTLVNKSLPGSKLEEGRGGFQSDHKKEKYTETEKNWLNVLEQQEFMNALLF